MPNTAELTVYFLLNKGVHVLDLAGPMQALHEASKRGAKVDLHYIGFEACLTSHQGLQFANVDKPPETVANNSIIMVAASHYSEAIYTDPASLQSITWLNRINTNANTDANANADANNNILIVGICTSSILLAKSGMLNGKRCTTHHSLRGGIERQYPKVQFEWDKLFVEDGNIITSAEVTAGLDLTLHLIERFFGYALSLAIARDLVVYRRRMGNDAQLSVHVQYRNHVHPLVHDLQDYIQANFQNKMN